MNKSKAASIELQKHVKNVISNLRSGLTHLTLDGVDTTTISALLNVCVEYDNWADHTLSGSDWKLIEAISYLLKFFSETVLIFESESCPTMHEVIPRIYSLKERISGFIESSSNVQVHVRILLGLLFQ